MSAAARPPRCEESLRRKRHTGHHFGSSRCPSPAKMHCTYCRAEVCGVHADRRPCYRCGADAWEPIDKKAAPDPLTSCGPDCRSLPPITDDVGGDEHQDCPAA